MNIVMVAVKVAVGWVFGSIALVADGIHSLSDLLTDVLVLVGTWVGIRPADRGHPYGHGKVETASALLIGVALVLVGGRIAWVAGSEMYERHHAFPGVWVLVVAALSVVGKEWLYQITRRVAVRVESPALYANAWHHRSDAFAAFAVMLGAGAGMLGWGHGDQVAGVVVGLMVVGVGIKVLMDAFVELSEGSADPATVEKLRNAMSNESGVRSFHRLRSRRVGREVFLDVHILVDPSLTVIQGHTIANRVESAVRTAIRRPANVVVHIEPDLPELRRDRTVL
jgi:cation diffusion facilitator family transporter